MTRTKEPDCPADHPNKKRSSNGKISQCCKYAEPLPRESGRTQECLAVEKVGTCAPDNLVKYELKNGECVAVGKTDIFLCFKEKCPTALGNIATDPAGFVSFFLKFALMLAGLAIILVLIVIGYRVLTSGGDPEKLQSAKELATSLFAGVLLIIFSLVLLQAIGVDILGLPGFGR